MGEGRAPSAESHPFPADKPGPRAAPVSPPRASPVPAPRRPAAASCSTHLESVPDGRAATRAPGTDSELARWRRRRGGGGSADTRKGRPAAAGERDRARGGRRRRHGAHTLAHTRSHSTPGRSPPEGPRGGRGERCNLLATVGNCKGARGPRPLFAQRAGPRQPGPDGACKPRAALGHRLRRGARGFFAFFPTRGTRGEKKCGSRCRPGLGGKASFFSFSSPPAPFPPPPSRGLEPLGSPPRGSAARAPRGVTASRQSRRGGPRPPTA